MSISVTVHLKDIRSNPLFHEFESRREWNSGTPHLAVKGMLRETPDANEGYRLWQNEQTDEWFVQLRLAEGARILPRWLNARAGANISGVTLVSTFSCANRRPAGRYMLEEGHGTCATAVLTRRMPDISVLGTVNADRTFLASLILIAENRVTIDGDPATAFELYYRVRRGKIAPTEDWDAALVGSAE